MLSNMYCSQLLRKSLLRSRINNMINKSIVSIRCVHSTNASEIDYLITRYRLTSLRNKPIRHSLLTYFNTITNFSYKSSRDIISDFLQTQLCLSKTNANALLDKYPILAEKTVSELEQQFKQLSNYNLELNQYYDCPWILYYPISLIEELLVSLRNRLQTDISLTNDRLVLLLFTSQSLSPILNPRNSSKTDDESSLYLNFVKRAEYFTEKLNISHEEFCYLLRDHPYLFKIKFHKIEQIMSMLLNTGVKPIDIVSGISIFQSNADMLKQRVETLKETNANIKPKPWVLKTSSNKYDAFLKRRADEKKELKDCSNIIEYLAHKLNCSEKIIESIAQQYPRIVNTSLIKLSSVITFLYDNGFVSYHVINNPSILYYKVDTLRKRKLELEKLKLVPSTLSVFTISQEEFKKLIDKLDSISEHESDIKYEEIQQIKN